jgi:hypothetical protein
MRGLIVGALVLAFAGAPCAAKAGSACAPNATLQADSAILQSIPTLTEPATRFLPDDGTARLYFHHVLGTGVSGGAVDSFSVFESPWLSPAWLNSNRLVPLVAVAPAPDAAGPAFLNTDSVQLQFQAQSAANIPWHPRTFIVVDCEGGVPVAWGSVQARVADTRVAAWICVVLAILVYAACMLSLQDKRKPGGSALFRWVREMLGTFSPANLERESHFARTYPAVFKRQELDLIQLFNPIHLTVNEVGVPSVQKFQVILFSSVVVGLLLYLVLRVGNLVSLSGSVVSLIGISGVSAAASAGVTQQNKRLSFDNWAWLQDEKILVNTDEPRPALWSDLITSSHDFDIYKMQAMVFSVVVAIALFIAGAGGELDTFTVPDALLGVLGLSQVTYIGGLLTQPPSVGDLDTALTKLRSAYDNWQTAINQGTDVDSDGHLLTAPVTPPAQPGFNAKVQFNKQVKTIVPMIETALEAQVNRKAWALQPLPKPPEPVQPSVPARWGGKP